MRLINYSISIRSLEAEDASAYVALRKAMLAEAPLAYLATAEDDIATHLEAVQARLGKQRGDAIIGAFAEQLVGVVGLFRARAAKAAHKAHVWGMYVAPNMRRIGVGRALLDTAIAHARELDGVRSLHLSVSSAAPGALLLYQAAGFHAWGLEPDAIQFDGQFADEHHMIFPLDP